MDHVKKTTGFAAPVGAAAAMGTSAAFALTGRWPLLWLYLLSLPALLRCTGVFRGRENEGMFLILAVTGLPANGGMIFRAVRSDVFGAMTGGSLLREVLWGIVLFAVLFSLEQVVMAAVTRIFWPRQAFDRPERRKRPSGREREETEN